MKKLLVVLAVAFSLGGCAGTPIGDVLRLVTSTHANPLGEVDIYRAKNVYAAALTAVDEYRTFCWSKSYKDLMADPISKPVCQNRRSVVRLAQSAKKKARFALDAAEAFIANNPTLNAATVISAAWAAVTAFQNSVPRRQP